jgi:hypothetical protein
MLVMMSLEFCLSLVLYHILWIKWDLIEIFFETFFMTLTKFEDARRRANFKSPGLFFFFLPICKSEKEIQIL